MMRSNKSEEQLGYWIVQVNVTTCLRLQRKSQHYNTSLMDCSVLHSVLNEAEILGPKVKMYLLNTCTFSSIIELSSHLKFEC